MEKDDLIILDDVFTVTMEADRQKVRAWFYEVDWAVKGGDYSCFYNQETKEYTRIGKNKKSA